ncbi:hypothetical protein [Microbacterium sp. Leaf320]|uniref:hypothetical protein n=1 Tax=Microbacterium sp. Leaf320 TaxID=1736334 RepID=UPI000B1DE416|nr:hypothetical protein [Microbacterium sp. Leaf320]
MLGASSRRRSITLDVAGGSSAGSATLSQREHAGAGGVVRQLDIGETNHLEQDLVWWRCP